jgi:hypothetical protein
MRLARFIIFVACATPVGVSAAQSSDSTRAPASPAVGAATPLQAFEARAKAKKGGGRFVDDEELRKKETGFLSDVVMKLAGIQKVQVRGAVFAASTKSRGQVGRNGAPTTQRCYVAVYEEGMQLYRMGGGDNPPDLARLPVRDYGGIEFYPEYALVPNELATVRQSDCGVLLLWKRAR